MASFAAVLSIVLLGSCGDDGRISEVTFKQYAEPRCWFRKGEIFSAFLVVAGGDHDGERVPWFVSSRCIAKEDMPNYGSAMLYLLGPPYVVDPRGLLQKHVTPNMATDNVRTHLPAPSDSSPVYYIVARLEPHPNYPGRVYEVIAVNRVVPTDVSFLQLMEMGPKERSELLMHVS